MNFGVIEDCNFISVWFFTSITDGSLSKPILNPSIEEKMKANNISGEKIEVTSSGKYCISDENGMISKNGKHWAIKVNDTVFDNFHPNGISYTEWYEDLGGEVYFKYSMIIKIMSSW